VAVASPEYVQESKKVLEERLGQVEAELAERRRVAAPGGERPGFGKRAGDYVAQVVEDRTNNQLADALAATATAIRQALVLIDEGRYGSCLSCGGPIAEDRLHAVPWALLCMECQSAGERREGSSALRRRNP
jgi:RNA polymerase-binding transcription factor DksA